MEAILLTVLLLILFTGLVVLLGRWPGQFVSPQAERGQLIYGTRFCLSCLKRWLGTPPCDQCELRPPSRTVHTAPAAEEIDGGPGSVPRWKWPTDLGSDLERVRRLLDAMSRFLGRLIKLLAMQPTPEVARVLERVRRLLDTASQFLGRLIELLTALPTYQAIRALERPIALLWPIAFGKVRSHR